MAKIQILIEDDADAVKVSVRGDVYDSANPTPTQDLVAEILGILKDRGILESSAKATLSNGVELEGDIIEIVDLD